MALIGRTLIYPNQWKVGILSSQYKKGDMKVPTNYRQLCMLSHVRKTIEAVLADAVLKKFKIFIRQFGFRQGLSSMITFLDVDMMVREGHNKIAFLDLLKAYDKVNCVILVNDCERNPPGTLTKMIRTCLTPLSVKTKGDLLDTTYRSTEDTDDPRVAYVSHIIHHLYQ